MASVGYSISQYAANPGLFLDFVATKLEWGDLAGNLVLDVGCGNPEIKMADLLVERFPNVQQVVAIDNKAHLIMHIRCKKPNLLIEHRCADIEKRNDMSPFEGIVDKVLSSHCFHMVKEQAAAFSNIFFMLRHGGEAAFFFCLWAGYADWITDITQNIKWKKYFNGSCPAIPVTQFTSGRTEKYYTKLLEHKGFEVKYCRRDKLCVPYPSDQECREGLLKLGTCSFSVPDEEKDEFCSYLFDSFLKHNERDEEGRPSQISYYLTAMVRKPIK